MIRIAGISFNKNVHVQDNKRGQTVTGPWKNEIAETRLLTVLNIGLIVGTGTKVPCSVHTTQPVPGLPKKIIFSKICPLN